MHVVECPKCHRKFKVAQPVVNAQMKCSRCGTGFLGSSTSAADGALVARPALGQPPRPAVPAGPGAAGAPFVPVRPSNSGLGPILLAATVLMVVGVVVFGIVMVRRLQTRTVITKDPKTGQVLSKEEVSTEEAQRRVKERLAAEARGRNRRPPGDPSDPSFQPPDQSPGPAPATGPVRPPDSPVDEPIPGSDPKLAVSPPRTVDSGPVGEDRFAVGFVRSEYDVVLESITVRLYVDGAPGPARTFHWIPPRGTIRYSLALGSEQGKPEVRAQAKPAASDVLVWEIPRDKISRSRTASGPEMAAYNGEFRNNYAVPGGSVEVYVDYFAEDGTYGGLGKGRLDQDKTVGVGKLGQVVFEIPLVHEPVAKIFVARAKGVKY